MDRAGLHHVWTGYVWRCAVVWDRWLRIIQAGLGVDRTEVDLNELEKCCPPLPRDRRVWIGQRSKRVGRCAVMSQHICHSTHWSSPSRSPCKNSSTSSGQRRQPSEEGSAATLHRLESVAQSIGMLWSIALRHSGRNLDLPLSPCWAFRMVSV